MITRNNMLCWCIDICDCQTGARDRFEAKDDVSEIALFSRKNVDQSTRGEIKTSALSLPVQTNRYRVVENCRKPTFYTFNRGPGANGGCDTSADVDWVILKLVVVNCLGTGATNSGLCQRSWV